MSRMIDYDRKFNTKLSLRNFVEKVDGSENGGVKNEKIF